MSTSRLALKTAGAAALVVLLAACSPGTTDESTGSGNGGSSGGDSPVADVVADVEAVMQARDEIGVPEQEISGDVSSLAGSTVYYIPLSAQVSVFQLMAEKLGEALSAVDVEVNVCDGGANPSQVASCIDQAVGASAGAIVADNVPYGMAANALDGARAAGIPVLLANHLPDAQRPADETLAYLPGPATQMVTSVAQWMIADSQGTATVMIQKVTDNPMTIAYAEAAEAEVADRCPDCTVVVNEVSAGNFPLIPSSTSSALLSTPDVGYVLTEFDHFVQPTIGGIQQSGKAADIQIGSSAATLAGLQMVADGNMVSADAGHDMVCQGWAAADAVLRMMLGEEVPEYDVPFRLFTADNIGDIELTEEAEASGEWYGPTGYREQFPVLWGLG